MVEAMGTCQEIEPSLAPVIQVHVTRRCNLRCLHCYSLSGPERRDLLTSTDFLGAIADARDQGYRVVSFSGGEPVLYRDLPKLLEFARSLGLRTTVTSNGMLLAGERLEGLIGHTDVLAISLDGIPESHNRMRGNPKAFDEMAKNLEAVGRSGIPFGFIFTLTQHNVDELEWAADFAAAAGASLFQIHPLEEVGRAFEELNGSRPDEQEGSFAFLVAQGLRLKYQGRMFVQFDLFHRDLVRRFPERFNAGDERPAASMLSQCVTPLVLEADGTAVPLGYGFARRYAIGSILEKRLNELAGPWIQNVYPGFRALCRTVYQEACQPSELPFFNWYELVELRSQQAAGTAA